MGPRRRGRGPGGGLARPAAARVAARVTDLVDSSPAAPASPRAARAQVRHDETRLFLVAVTRARRRLRGHRGAQRGRAALAVPRRRRPPADDRAFTDVARPLTLPAWWPSCAAVAGPDPATPRGGGHRTRPRSPRTGPGRRPGPVVGPARPHRRPAPAAPGVRVGVAVDDRPLRRCRLQWVLRAAGGDGPSMGAQDIGTLVHEVAHDLGDTDAADLCRGARARWGRLGLAPGWLSRRDLGRAEAMTTRLARYLDEAGAVGWRRAASEERIRVALGRAVVTGQVDRVEAAPTAGCGSSTSRPARSKPTVDEVRRHGQLGAYQLAVERGRLREHGVRAGGRPCSSSGGPRRRRAPPCSCSRRSTPTTSRPGRATSSTRSPRAWQAPSSPPPRARSAAPAR